MDLGTRTETHNGNTHRGQESIWLYPPRHLGATPANAWLQPCHGSCDSPMIFFFAPRPRRPAGGRQQQSLPKTAPRLSGTLACGGPTRTSPKDLFWIQVLVSDRDPPNLEILASQIPLIAEEGLGRILVGPLVGKNRDGAVLVRWARQSKMEWARRTERTLWSPDALTPDGSRTTVEDVLQWLNGTIVGGRDWVEQYYTEPDATGMDADDDPCLVKVRCLRQMLECNYALLPVCLEQCYHPHASISMVCAFLCPSCCLGHFSQYHIFVMEAIDRCAWAYACAWPWAWAWTSVWAWGMGHGAWGMEHVCFLLLV